MSDKPKIFIFCERCVSDDWHVATAIAEDGTALAGHVCSNHGHIRHDMGMDGSDWKHPAYVDHYPDGFELEYVEVLGPDDIMRHDGLRNAYARGRVPVEGP